MVRFCLVTLSALTVVPAMSRAASPASAQALASHVRTQAFSPPLLDSIKVDEQGVDTVYGTASLQSGTEYTMVISGTSNFSNGENLDALYCVGGGQSTGCPARGATSLSIGMDTTSYFYPPDAYQSVDDTPDVNCNEATCPHGLAYKSSHIYTMAFWPPATGKLKVDDYAAALRYSHNSPETGTFTIDIYGNAAAVSLPKDTRSPDSPKEMPDRIPPHVNTMIEVDVTGATPANPVTLESVGDPEVTFDGESTYAITQNGTYYPMLSASAQTPCGAGPDVRIEALQYNQVLAQIKLFAVSSIPITSPRSTRANFPATPAVSSLRLLGSPIQAVSPT